MSCGKSVAVVAAASEPKEEQQRRALGIIRHEPTNNRMDAFPWMTEFRAMSRLPTRPGSLIKLIKFFNKHVSANVVDCYKKSSRAAKLKDHVREALLLFMYLYRFEQPQDQNRAVYLEQMSDLLAVYVDLELVASKRETEPQPCRTAARLVSSLCLCLENSTEHLLDTLIKVQLVNETFSDILDPVISKVIKLSSPPPRSKLDGLAYARYLLVYRLWKRLHINLAARKNIVAAALEALRSEPPSDLPTDIFVKLGVLPSTQNTQSDRPTTKHYLCQSYDLRNACVEFVKYSRSLNVVDEVVQPTVVFASTSSSSSSSERDPRHLAMIRRKRRQRDVVLIDLTNEPITRVIRARPRIGWLESTKRCLRRIDVAARLRNKLKAKALIRVWRTLLDIDKVRHRIKVEDKRESNSPTPKLISLKEYQNRAANRLKKPELKVKPYTSLQQPVKSLVDDAVDKAALQVEVRSSEQLPTKQEYSYVLEEQVIEGANDNANVILNGETVMLLQKSSNSNLYIVDKAAADSSKLNYDSKDEMSELMQPEDAKPTLKMEPEYPTYPPHRMQQLSVNCETGIAGGVQEANGQ